MYQQVNIAELNLITKHRRNEGKETIIIMHGYGADNQDLAPLAEVLDPNGHSQWYFPNAPLEVPIGPHMKGRAWFPIDMEALERAMMSGTHRDMSGQTPEGLLSSADKIVKLIEELNVDPSDLIIGGFSQGAMLACEVALRLKSNVKGLILLSATLISEERWRTAAKSHVDLKVFQSHGTADPILGFSQAESLRDLLDEAGASVKFKPFDGAHEIPQPVMQGVTQFLADIRGA